MENWDKICDEIHIMFNTMIFSEEDPILGCKRVDNIIKGRD